ncbi:hypothetical protein ScalyP_jg11554, partial [Parmales sp. scaly parma]
AGPIITATDIEQIVVGYLKVLGEGRKGGKIRGRVLRSLAGVLGVGVKIDGSSVQSATKIVHINNNCFSILRNVCPPHPNSATSSFLEKVHPPAAVTAVPALLPTSTSKTTKFSYEVSDLIKKLRKEFVEVLFDTGKNQNQNQKQTHPSEHKIVRVSPETATEANLIVRAMWLFTENYKSLVCDGSKKGIGEGLLTVL